MNDQFSSLELPASIVFAAGETKVFYLSGSYFELIDCPNPVDVILSDRNGGVRARLLSAGQTYHVKNTPYSIIQITSASAQTIRIAYGSGEAGTRNTAGSVSVLNAVALDAATLAALESVDLNAATVAALNRPKAATGKYVSSAAVAANTPDTIFTPAANVNGAILLYAESTSLNTTSQIFPTFIAKMSAPVNVSDGEVIHRSQLAAFINTNFVEAGCLQEPQFIPAGLGLYYIQSGPSTPTRSCRFVLL